MRHGKRSSGPPERRSALGVIENVEDAICERRGVAVVDDIAVSTVVDELGHSTHGGSDDGPSGGHGFE